MSLQFELSGTAEGASFPFQGYAAWQNFLWDETVGYFSVMPRLFSSLEGTTYCKTILP